MIQPNSKETTSRERFLKDFKETNNLLENKGLVFIKPDYIKKLGMEITNFIKKKDLTYTEAYASLQYAYNLLQFESNFVQVSKEKLVEPNYHHEEV